MASVLERSLSAAGKPLFLCDFSPPRGPGLGYLDYIKLLDMDFVCVAYNPSKSVRADSAMLSHQIKAKTGKDVVFNLACRDMNKLAIQSHLLGAAILGLENVIIVQGDAFSERDRALAREVSDFKATDLIAAVRAMNQGVDYRGLKLTAPTRFCIGATLDLGKGIEQEARRTEKKLAAGAQFFITQSVFQVSLVQEFLDSFRRINGHDLAAPVFYGLYILDKDGVFFGDIPPQVIEELEKGRSGLDIALDVFQQFVAGGINTFYLIPPIMKGGIRKYDVAQMLVETARRSLGVHLPAPD
ncbi:MAG: methylenetetrahydrofolate reductase [Chloroflexi bacterium]|nr:methylenetetrahydrofolate reductase [Chloroflexota bacterium]